ncbi:MAG: hypothetical protein K6G83_14450 [Lachnospiraceae bacterium]|nr:hypothetical protein [Lachnospiraceae bacterium]
MDKRMTWNEITQKYPERWVALKEAEMDGPNIISGIVTAVKTDDEIYDYEPEHLHEGLIFERTTEGEWSGIIDSNLATMIDNVTMESL